MIITAKWIAIFLGLALTAFTVSTIVLAVQKNNLENDLKEAREKLDYYEEAIKNSTTESPGSSSTTSTTAIPDPEPINYRLPNTMKPINYDLYLHPDIKTGNFSGKVAISIDVLTATKTIKLHSLNLTIQNVYVSFTGADADAVEKFYLDTKLEFLVIELKNEIPAGQEILLTINFDGSMTGKIVGLYTSSYLDASGASKAMATSKFEPTYARQAFPCFDEPAMKASFEITLVYPNDGGYHALSNMNINETKMANGYTEAYFKKSVPMSTYLACFIVSDFLHAEVDIETGDIGEPFTMRVFATPEQLDKVDFAKNVGKKVIEYYIDYFKIPYPLPKLDMAAIPDFVSGAMEHWGLVTFRETALLYDEAISSTANTQRIASVIAHEFAHMWFGNLVTMNWWNDLWLNEGFASYIENKGVDAVYPDWKMEDQFIIGTLHGVLSLDATLGAHPIIQTVENPDQITEIFDTITYSKGASIIRMLEGFLGTDIFQKAVTNYLNEFKYRNAVTNDFLTEIDKLNEVTINVTEIMRTWTEQMGLPVIIVEKISATQYKIKQKRFFSNPNDYDGIYNDSPFDYTWSIPITYKTSASNDIQSNWFYYNQNEIEINLQNPVDWIKFNIDQVGYYRVNYPEDMWLNLANKLIDSPNDFSVGDRASLLNDAFSLADSTQLSYDIALDMTKYLSKEFDYVPWSVASSKLLSLKRLLMFTPSYNKYKKYATDLIKPIYDQVTWTVDSNDGHLQKRLRVTILSAACSLGLQDCLTVVAELYNEFLSQPDKRPNPDLREAVYYFGMMAAGNEETWEKTWNLFVAETDASEKSKLMYGLSSIQEPWILSRYINLAWNESYVRGQDYFTCLQYIASNPVGEPLVWEYVREHWLDLVDRFGINERYLGSMIPSITSRFTTQTKLEEMQYFFDSNPNAGAGTAARVRALETVKNNIVWLDQNLQSIDKWLDQQEV